MEDYNNFYVHFEEVTGNDFEYSEWSWERKALPVMFVWEEFTERIAGQDYIFYKGDRFNPYKVPFQYFKKFYRSGLIGTTPRKPGISLERIVTSAIFILLAAFGILGIMVFMLNPYICVIFALLGIIGFIAVNYEDAEA